MSKLIPTLAGLVGAFFHHLSGTDDAQGFIGVTKLAVSADGVAPVLVGPNAPLPVKPIAPADITIAAQALDCTQTVVGVGFAPNGMGGCGIEIANGTGAWTGTLVVQVQTTPGGAWDTVSVIQRGTGLLVSTITANGRFTMPTATSSAVRVIPSIAGGTLGAAVTFNETAKAAVVGVECKDATRLNATVTQFGALNIATSQVTVDTTVGGKLIVAARPGRISLTIITEQTTAVRLGPSGVTAANGALFPGVTNASVTLNYFGGALYGIVASGTELVSIIETF